MGNIDDSDNGRRVAKFLPGSIVKPKSEPLTQALEYLIREEAGMGILAPHIHSVVDLSVEQAKCTQEILKHCASMINSTGKPVKT